MFPLKIIIIDTGEFTPLTEVSIAKNLPNADCWTYMRSPHHSIMEQALRIAGDELALVVLGGSVVELTEQDIPPLHLLKNYHIAAARSAVFSDNPKSKRFYRYLDGVYHEKIVDLGIFIINPPMWKGKNPNTLSDKKILAMPRYMNHKTDPLVTNGISSYQALKYGMLSEQAVVFNYREVLERGTITPIERYAYNIPKLLNYTELLEPKSIEKIKELAGRQSIETLRKGLAKAMGVTR